MALNRRQFLASVSVVALAGPTLARADDTQQRVRVRPLPLEAVRLKPSRWRHAVETNHRFLLSLEPDRLLHNFHASAGLPPKGEVYGGWEARGIAGHSLGHYLSACSLMFAQTGDAEVRERVRYIVSELARCQAAHGDGYIGGTTVERNEKIVDGKIVFEELRRGDIRTGPFDVNGGWVPLYTWHKVQAGLVDAHRYAQVEEAMPVLVSLAGYLGSILEGFDDAQMQTLLACEHGGLNEAYADTYALTGDKRWLSIAERIRDRRILDPLTARKDILPGLHANTQIPKLIGLARLYELTGEAGHATATRFFYDTVTRHHSYVIGGNSEREHFGPADVISTRITDRTCEHCNSYNMLKLARHLYGWAPDASLFDFYERVHLNHILAQQHPETGMFAYFMPLGPGARRLWSLHDDCFWCCVGSGMESHAKHGDSIYWEDGTTLFVNLFIPSTLDWNERRLKLDLDTDFPDSEVVTLTIAEANDGPLALALRLPGWCDAPRISLNGIPAAYDRRGGYAVLTRRWRVGDRLTLTLPMRLRMEATPDDPCTLAYSHGPVVLAADLGPSSKSFDQASPALLAAAIPTPVESTLHSFRLADAKPAPLMLKPFFSQYDRRTAVYFPIATAEQWAEEERAFTAGQWDKSALDARTIDALELGDIDAERAHGFASNHSDLFAWAGRTGRQAPWGTGNYLEFDLAVHPGPMLLHALYWGEEIDKNFVILVEGEPVAAERRPGPAVSRFIPGDYPIPLRLTESKSRVHVRFETKGTDALVYECQMLTPQSAQA